jgi:hypothetical protein
VLARYLSARCGSTKMNSGRPATARTIDNPGTLLRDQGDLVSARPLLERALAIRKKVFGPDDVATATGLTGLGLLLRQQGDLVQARLLLERARAIRETLGPDHPNTAHSVNNLAEVLCRLNEFDAPRCPCSKMPSWRLSEHSGMITPTPTGCAAIWPASCFEPATSRTDCRSLELRSRLTMSA